MGKYDRLELHFDRLLRRPASAPYTAVALSVLDDPQAHIDALVEAGVLYRFSLGPTEHYAIAPPHQHEWHVYAQALQNDWVAVKCLDCAELRRLPIEVPDA